MIEELRDRAEALARAIQGNILRAKARCYQRCFLDDDGTASADGSRVLADLRRYCRADVSGFSSDPAQAARIAGRREVWLRITEYLNLDDAQVRRLVEVETDYVD